MTFDARGSGQSRAPSEMIISSGCHDNQEPVDTYVSVLKTSNDRLERAFKLLVDVEDYFDRAMKDGKLELKQLAASVWEPDTPKSFERPPTPDDFDAAHVFDELDPEETIKLRIAYRSTYDLSVGWREFGWKLTYLMRKLRCTPDAFGPYCEPSLTRKDADLIEPSTLPMELRQTIFSAALKANMNIVEHIRSKLESLQNLGGNAFDALSQGQEALSPDLCAEWLAASPAGRKVIMAEHVSSFVAKVEAETGDIAESLKRENYSEEWAKLQALYSHELWVEFKLHWDMFLSLEEDLYGLIDDVGDFAQLVEDKRQVRLRAEIAELEKELADKKDQFCDDA